MGSLVLRQIRDADRWTLWGWRNSERVRRVSLSDGEIARADHDAWFTEHFPGLRNKTIMVEWDGEAVGWFQIEQWDQSIMSGEWGVTLGEPNRAPIGLGGSLPLLALTHAFKRLNASSMTGRVLDANTNMVSIMRRLRVPIIDHIEEPSRLARGDAAGMTVYRVERSEWPQLLESGLSHVPSGLRSAITATSNQPIAD